MVIATESVFACQIVQIIHKFKQFLSSRRRLAPEPKLLAQEEVTYAEPVLVAPSKPLNSPKATLRKTDNNMFQFQDGYNAPPYQRPSNRDHFGTLRSQREAAKVGVYPINNFKLKTIQ